MDAEDKQTGLSESVTADARKLFGPVRAALLEADESHRYRLLASLLVQLADTGDGATGRKMVPAEQLDSFAKKVQSLDQERATLDDSLKSTRADLDQCRKQLEAEQVRAQELQKLIDEQRARLQTMTNDASSMEAELVAKNAELHKAEVKIDELTLTTQRAELATHDLSKVEAWEEERRDMTARIEALREEKEQLRLDKDAEIEKLKEDLRGSTASAGASGEAALAQLWERLAAANPPLAEGHVAPTAQAAQRLVDGFIELVRFVDEFDKSMRVFLGRYTQHHPTVRVPWEAYAKGDDLHTVASRTVAVQGGRPVGVLKMRLRLLNQWIVAAMIASDSSFENIASELESHLRGPVGAGTDRNRKIMDFLRDDGHELFLQQIRELRSVKLGEAFGRGG